MGLKLEYYEFVILELEKISLFCNQSNDVQQCFKYPLKKDKIKADYKDFVQKIDSVKNVAYLGALIRVKNTEDLKRNKKRKLLKKSLKKNLQ